MMVDYDRIYACTEPERMAALEVVDLMRMLGVEARRYGLLHLENNGAISASLFLKKGVTLVVSGTEPTSVRRILANYISTTKLSNLEYFKRILYMDGLLHIQQGSNPDVLEEHLCSYFGEDYIEFFSEHFTDEDDVQRRMNQYMKEEIDNGKSPELDIALMDMDTRSLQRMLRECSLATIHIACVGASKSLRQKIIQSIAIAQWANYLDSTEMFEEITLAMIRGSQAFMIEAVEQLRAAGEIL